MSVNSVSTSCFICSNTTCRQIPVSFCSASCCPSHSSSLQPSASNCI
jgi:hypothetical protein